MYAQFTARPYASNGVWLCCLLPLAMGTSYMHTYTKSPACISSNAVHRFLIVAVVSMGLRTLCSHLNSLLHKKDSIILDSIFGLLPGTVATLCFKLLPEMNWLWSLACGFLIPLGYQCIYVSVQCGFPKTFTVGEASIMVQGLALFMLNAIFRIYDLYQLEEPEYYTHFGPLNALMQSALIFLLFVCGFLAYLPLMRRPVPFYLLMGLLAMAVMFAPVTTPLPLITLLKFIFKDQKRLYIIVFYLSLVGLTCATVSWQLKNTRQASTSVRKIFHLLIVLVYVPGIFFECALLYIATGIAFAAFVVMELLRLLNMPPFAQTLREAFNSFKDVKDSGQLAFTPFCLLIGCSLPIWITPCPCERDSNGSQLALLAGILAVGVGDTAASVVGSKYGRNNWPNSNRSLEGTAAFVVSILASVWMLQLSGLLVMNQAKWVATVFAAWNSALVEAFTDQVDNLVLPLVFYILVGFA